ncbi:NAD(P)H-hydrate dehydratase [uncultured Ferrimonas sp.]|uniref:NAD(P)H-hydrate dehydratase n=1 Tax=uncultured Ferrimonas sp. TaxID=432640 RepID=UPI002630F164|nr:NAD(P)H-hydrate dehydratase [uncultured Ferrimonas sp.]
MRADLCQLPSQLNLASTIRVQEPQLAAQLGLALYPVMEQAGQQAFALLQQRWPTTQRLCVLCGSGNNAGDGYVVARLAKEAGWGVVLLQHDCSLKGDALTAQQAWLAAGGVILPLTGEWPEAEIFVDALLGTGLQGPLRPAIAAAVAQLNQRPQPVLALDIPTGLHGDTGCIANVAVSADVTITFVATKLGLVTGHAAAVVGEVILAPLQLGAGLAADGHLLQPPLLQQLPPRGVLSHKGDHGKLLLLGGGDGMAGAARLAGEAALRSGAGLVAIGCAASSVDAIVAPRPELMAAAADSVLETRLAWASVIAIGPGLGQNRWGQQLWQQALAAKKPLLVDADALNLLAQQPQRRDNWLLTPHPGEAARLLDCSVADVCADRLAAATEIQRRYGGVVILKGAGSLIVTATQWAVAPVGNSGLATGGSGDVLSGILAGLMAQGLDLYQAACFGVLIHGEAADSAFGVGARGMLPSDLFEHIRYWVNQGTL